MKISQLSKATGVSPRSIRHYEKKRLLTANRLENDYREFDESAVECVKTTQIFLRLGLSTLKASAAGVRMAFTAL